MKINNTEIKIIQGDITDLKVGAIVNAANNKLVMGGGVAGAIRKKGGAIHAATMSMDFKTDEIKIRDAARNALKVAEELKIASIAFPALGCGTGGFPLLAAAKIMAQETFRHLHNRQTCLKEIIFCLYDQAAFEVFNKGVISYLEYIIHKLQQGPFCTVDALIEIDGGLVIIERSNPPFGWALPGGFVDYGESLEDAVSREIKEETNLEAQELKQFHAYSNPGRDPRFHTIGTVFIAKVKGEPKAGDDAAGLKVIPLENLLKLDFAFDHKQIIEDYLKHKNGENHF